MSNRRRIWFLRILALALCAAAGLYLWARFAGPGGGPPPARPQAVRAAVARIGDMDVYFQALGTVSSPNTVTVKSRVDGELTALHFTEGQLVRQGEPLAQIDPRPFEVQLQQAKGQLARDQALLRQAEQELERYRKLIRERSISEQQLESQEGLVGQYQGTILADQAAVADAELQLTYSRITAPVSGRVGLRRVDPGNIIRASDSDGIVVITQMRPMNVIFTLVEKQIPEVVKAMFAARDAGGQLTVEAWSQDNKSLLATGFLLTIDNQIDPATGTVKAKAEFANDDFRLFPNQFVNARLKVRTLEKALIIPTAAVQRNNDGFFVWLEQKGAVRAVAVVTGHTTDAESVIVSGLAEGDVIITDGVDRLRDGTTVQYDNLD
ncbi:MdtA/MuxA family multidrug efflux RND transporter periplasmic adaptor subunit [Desulfovibrio sp. OttesenSCG-928-G11]|nr:MdtA/MuxA family multidrug efflux RND transporter periplasmic adaptor subunit [Desulfovibrio sp. OttesenSCG-928-G11]